MSTTVELERLVVRLIGDGSQYDSVLKAAEDATKLLGTEMKRLGGTEKEFEQITARAAGVVKQAEVALGSYRTEQSRLQGLLELGWVSQEAYNRQLGKAESKLSGVTQALITHNQLVLQGIQVTQSSENATERHASRVRELDQLLGHGAISQQTYNRALSSSLSTLPSVQQAQKRLADEVARARQYTEGAVTATGRHSKTVQELDTLLKRGSISQGTYNRALFQSAQTLPTVAAAQQQINSQLQRANQIVDSNVTALERYKNAVREASTLLERGRISQETFNREISRAKKELDAASPSLRKFGQDASSLGGSLRGVGFSLSLYVTGPIVALLTAAAAAGVKMDTLRRSLTSVTGSASETNIQLARLREVAKLPGLGFAEAIEGSVNLQSAGFSAAQAERSLMAFGNALASVGKGKAELVMVNRALTQIMGKGKVMAQEINQVAEHLPQIRRAMMGAFGTANTETLQGMGMSSEEFITGIVAELEKLPKMTSGIKVELENLSDATFVALSKVGDAITSLLIPVLQVVTPLIDWLGTAFEGLHPWIQNTLIAIALLVASLGPLLVVVGTAIIFVGALATAYTAITAITISLTVVYYALAVAVGIASLALAGLAVGGILAVSNAIYQSMPSIQKYNDELVRSQMLSSVLIRREQDKAKAILETAKAMEGSARKAFLGDQLKSAEKNLEGLSWQLQNAKKNVDDAAPSWVSLWQSGRKEWDAHQETLKETEARLSAQSTLVNELNKELVATKVDKVGPSEEALKDLEKFSKSMQEQTATINMTARQAKIYDLAMQGVGGTVVQNLLQQDRYLTGLEEQKKKQEDLKGKLTDFNTTLRQQAATQGMSTDQVERWKLAQAGATVAQLRQVEAMQKYAAALKLKDDVKELTTNLQKDIATVGMSADAIKLYELRQRGATQATLAHVQALMQRKNAMDAQGEATKLVTDLRTQIQTFGMSTDQIKLYELAQKGASRQTLALASALLLQKTNMEEGKKLTEKHLDPLAKYTNEYKKLRDLFAGGNISARTFQEELKAIDKELVEAKANAHVNLVFSVEGNDAVRAGTKEFNDLLNNIGKDQAAEQLKLQMARIRGGINMAATVAPGMPRIPVPGLPSIPTVPTRVPTVPAAGPGAAPPPAGGSFNDNVLRGLLTRIAEAVEGEAERTPIILKPLGVGGTLT